MEASTVGYYAKTLIFVQSSGMGKSRLADAFGRYCPMINFVLREEGTTGYPPPDGEVLSFMLKSLSETVKRKITDSPQAHEIASKLTLEEAPGSKPPSPKKARISSPRANEESEIFLENWAVTIWNHSIAVGLLQASFEICM